MSGFAGFERSGQLGRSAPAPALADFFDRGKGSPIPAIGPKKWNEGR
jgi:hypothetical protein